MIYGVEEYARDFPQAFDTGLDMRFMCNHGCYFDEGEAQSCDYTEVRKRWPRFFGLCSECGYQGIYYDSMAHYIYGDW